jgi:hypothetical protein
MLNSCASIYSVLKNSACRFIIYLPIPIFCFFLKTPTVGIFYAQGKGSQKNFLWKILSSFLFLFFVPMYPGSGIEKTCCEADSSSSYRYQMDKFHILIIRNIFFSPSLFFRITSVTAYCSRERWWKQKWTNDSFRILFVIHVRHN